MIAFLPRRRTAGALLAALALSVPGRAIAADGPAARAERSWFVPDHARLQLAGEIGFFSSGLGYDVADGALELDLLFGWVPARYAGDEIYSLTGRFTWAPWRLRGARWSVAPLRASLQLTHTIGSRFFTRQPHRYPSGYYDLPTGWYTGVALGGEVTREVRGRDVGVYCDLVALPMQLRDWRRNRDVIDASDVVSLAVGAVVRF